LSEEPSLAKATENLPRLTIVAGLSG